MTLRRTSLARKSELKRRTPMPRRTRELKARVVRTTRRQRATGPTPAQRNLVAERASYACEVCGVRLHDGTSWTRAHSFHHRQPRGAGGSSRPDVNSPANILLTCGTGVTGCHGMIESNRAIAYRRGWLVKHGLDPATVSTHLHAGVVLLTADGDYQRAAA
jgi:hypothetical protein